MDFSLLICARNRCEQLKACPGYIDRIGAVCAWELIVVDAGQDARLAPRQLEHEIDNSPIRVSYIIITRNRGEHLKRTLTNVREFLTDQDELIVIDGGSTDATVDVVSDNRDIVSVFVSEPDSSEGHAINRGLLLARGRLIKSISDDDYFYPDAMRQLVAAAEEHPEIDAIQTGGEVWTALNGAPRFECFRVLGEDDGRPYDRRLFSCCLSGLGLIVRRRTLLKTGGISPGYKAVDGDWHCKLIEAGCRMRYLDVNLYRWTIYPHSGLMEGIELSRMNLAWRLKEWGAFYDREPRLAARITGIDNVPEGLGFQYAVYLIYIIWKGKARILLRPLPVLVRGLEATWRAWSWSYGHLPTGKGRRSSVAGPVGGFAYKRLGDPLMRHAPLLDERGEIPLFTGKLI